MGQRLGHLLWEQGIFVGSSPTTRTMHDETVVDVREYLDGVHARWAAREQARRQADPYYGDTRWRITGREQGKLDQASADHASRVGRPTRSNVRQQAEAQAEAAQTEVGEGQVV